MSHKAADHSEGSITIQNKFVKLAFCLLLYSKPAAAFHTECDYPAVFGPVLRLLHELTSLVQVAGLILAVFGLSVAGLIYITRFGGPDSVERARRIARNVLIGSTIMLMSEPVVAHLAQQLPGAC